MLDVVNSRCVTESHSVQACNVVKTSRAGMIRRALVLLLGHWWGNAGGQKALHRVCACNDVEISAEGVDKWAPVMVLEGWGEGWDGAAAPQESDDRSGEACCRAKESTRD